MPWGDTWAHQTLLSSLEPNSDNIDIFASSSNSIHVNEMWRASVTQERLLCPSVLLNSVVRRKDNVLNALPFRHNMIINFSWSVDRPEFLCSLEQMRLPATRWQEIRLNLIPSVKNVAKLGLNDVINVLEHFLTYCFTGIHYWNTTVYIRVSSQQY